MEGANSLSKGKLWAGELFYAPCLTVAGGGGPLKARPRNGPHPGWSKELVKVLEQGRGFTAEEGESGGRGGH